jgi:N-acyl-L-homoserine lactone synthetase
MEYVSGTAGELRPELFTGMARYRHRVFVEALGWDLAVRDGLEFDQFDRPDTRYVVARDDGGAIAGVARLLPTTDRYLLADVFPQLLGSTPVPCCPFVWELSRFAAVDFAGLHGAGQFSSPTAVGLLREVQRCAASCGIRALVTVSPIGVERLLRKAGFRAHRMAPPVLVEGHPLFACWMDLDPGEAASKRAPAPDVGTLS